MATVAGLATAAPPSPALRFDAALPETKQLLLEMLTAERDARLSEEMQLKFSQAGLDGWMDVCAAEQERLVTVGTGWAVDTAGHRAWLEGFRTAYLLYPSDKAFQEIPIQVKYNRRTVGLPEGFFVDAPLVSAADMKETSLATVVGRGPFVVISGSLT